MFLKSDFTLSILLCFLGLLFSGCSRVPPPMGPPPSPVPINVVTNSSGPIIEMTYTNQGGYNTGGMAGAFLVDGTGNPVTTGAVTMVTPAGTHVMPYIGVTTSNPPPGSGLPNINGGLYGGYVAYAAGQSCTFYATFGGTTYMTYFTASTATANIASSAAGVTCTWTNGGNEDMIWVSGNDNFSFGPTPTISSPYILPASSFPLDPAGSKNDIVSLLAGQILQPAFTGCQATSFVITGFMYIVSPY